MGITASTLLPNGWSDGSANQGPDPSQGHRVSSHRGQSFLLPQSNPAGPCRLRCSVYFAKETLPWDIWHRNWLLSARQFSFPHPCSFYPYCYTYSAVHGSGHQKYRSEVVIGYNIFVLVHWGLLSAQQNGKRKKNFFLKLNLRTPDSWWQQSHLTWELAKHSFLLCHFFPLYQWQSQTLLGFMQDKILNWTKLNSHSLAFKLS